MLAVELRTKALLRYLGRPSSVEKAIRQVTNSMEQIGIVVVDATAYRKTDTYNPTAKTANVVIAGYIPGKACIFKVTFNYGRFDDYTFTVEGQIADGKWGMAIMGGNFFNAVERNPVGSESCGGDSSFSINTYTSYSGGTSSLLARKKVEFGINFFKNVLIEYGDILAEQFTTDIHLWFVPEYSDEFKALKDKNGQNNSLNYIGFNSRVMAKFPVGFFDSSQTA